jgi:hypothetical protein
MLADQSLKLSAVPPFAATNELWGKGDSHHSSLKKMTPSGTTP